MIYWENIKIIKQKRCALFVCDICKKEQYQQFYMLRKKTYQYCYRCYNKSSDKKQLTLKMVKGRPSVIGKNNPNYKGKIEKHCKCGKVFHVSQNRKNSANFCSRKCNGIFNEKRNELTTIANKKRPKVPTKEHHCYNSIELTCRCGNNYVQKPNVVKKYKNTYCSKKCANRYSVKNCFKGEYNGIKMRSGWEIKFAQYLDSKNIKWTYEPESFETPFGFYTPDFWIPEWNIFVEVKGWFRKDAKLKFDFFKTVQPVILANEEYLKSLGIKLK